MNNPQWCLVCTIDNDRAWIEKPVDNEISAIQCYANHIKLHGKDHVSYMRLVPFTEKLARFFKESEEEYGDIEGYTTWSADRDGTFEHVTEGQNLFREPTQEQLNLIMKQHNAVGS